MNPVDFLAFLSAISAPLYKLYMLVRMGAASDASAEEQAKQLALELVRAAKDAQAKKEIEGP